MGMGLDLEPKVGVLARYLDRERNFVLARTLLEQGRILAYEGMSIINNSNHSWSSVDLYGNT